MRINNVRLLHHLESLAQIGALPGGGVRRLAFSEEDKQGRDYIERYMRELGLEVMIDAIGNILGVRPGAGSEKLVLIGSHTDTVGTGGRYDGSLGVLAALEVIHTLNEQHIQTHHGVGVISFVNEEGVRFMPDMMGSLYLTGQIGLEEVRAVQGVDGKTIGECLDEQTYSGADELPVHRIASFLELHIEQGPILLESDTVIGVVDRVQGILWDEVQLTGETNHAGVTPMSRRKDAGYVASAVAVHVRSLTEQIGGLRGTVGALTLSPNLINVIAEKATLTIDLRHAEKEQLARAGDQVHEAINFLAAKEGVNVSIKNLANVAPVLFDERCVASVLGAANMLGYSCRKMISGAGHDAQIMASRWPASMIFVPSQGAISHNINEYTLPEHVEAGANVLLHAVMQQTIAGT